MNPAAGPLARFQADFRAWLVAADEAAAGRIGPAAGLAVYQNNYRTALIASLEASYPRLKLWLGDSAFAAAAVHYADDHPPHSWTLDVFGDGLAGALAELYPDDPEVADLARLDWALGQAFVATDATPLDAAALAGVDWDCARLHFVPSLHRLELVSNADTLWLALASGETPPSARLAPGAVLVWRQGFESVMRRMDSSEAALLQQALAGEGFAQLCAGLAVDRGEQAAVAMAGEALGRWIAEGLVAAIG